MEDGTHAGERHADPASGALADFGPRGTQQRLMSRQRRSAGVGSAKTRARVRR
jgi:hypothetical protein